MNVNIYYGGRGLVDDPTITVLNKITDVLNELRVNVEKYNLFEMKNRKLKQLDNLNLTKECECMKKLIALVLTLACVLALTGCGKNDTYKIKIVVPAGSTEEIVYQEDFVYSDEEISPIGNKITIYSGDGLGDTEVVLKPISVKEENAYEPTYLTPGMPVEMDVEKGAWFKVGINMQNNTDTDKIVYVEIEGVEVRIE